MSKANRHKEVVGLGEIKEYPLSDADIRQILGDDIKILTYPDLGKLKHIDQCFDSKGRCILLFLTNGPTEGHWCCLLRKKKGILFWDSYGEPPEQQLEDIPEQRLAALDEDVPYLTKLMRESGKPIYYNTHQYQKESGDIATCGRWCVARCIYGDKSEEYFKKVVDMSKMPPDTFVSGLIANFLGK